MNYKNLKLDTTSEYIINNGRDMNVMVTGLEDEIRPLFINGDLQPDYIDTYVYIDPVLETATSIEFVAKYFDDTQDSVTLKLSNDVLNEGVDIFYTIMAHDSNNKLAEVIKEAKNMYRADRAERVGCIIDTFDDFLEKKDIYIPTSVREMSEAGESIIENTARIYGKDYDELSADVKNALAEDDLTIAEKWWRLHYPYVSNHSLDDKPPFDNEEDFVYHAIKEYGITGDFILYRIQDVDICQWFRRVAEEYGLI